MEYLLGPDPKNEGGFKIILQRSPKRRFVGLCVFTTEKLLLSNDDYDLAVIMSDFVKVPEEVYERAKELQLVGSIFEHGTPQNEQALESLDTFLQTQYNFYRYYNPN